MAASNARTSPAPTLTTPSDREIVMTRVLDAPRRRVLETWTKPEHLVRWWGCGGSTLPVCEIDLRPGGAWRFVLLGHDGKDYPFKGVYREIVPLGRLVHTQIFDMEPGSSHQATITVTFAEHLRRMA